MTVLRRMRRLAKPLICLDFLISLSWEVGFCFVGLIGAVIFFFSGKYSQSLELLGRVLAGVGLLGFVAWVAHDIKKHADRLGKPPESSGQDPSQQDTNDESRGS